MAVFNQLLSSQNQRQQQEQTEDAFKPVTVQATVVGFTDGRFQLRTDNNGLIFAETTSTGSIGTGDVVTATITKGREVATFVTKDAAKPEELSIPARTTSKIEELNGYIESPSVQTYPLIHSARYRSQVVQLIYSGAGTTATLDVANGDEIAIGGALNLDITVAGSSAVSFTVELKRIL